MKPHQFELLPSKKKSTCSIPCPTPSFVAMWTREYQGSRRSKGAQGATTLLRRSSPEPLTLRK